LGESKLPLAGLNQGNGSCGNSAPQIVYIFRLQQRRNIAMGTTQCLGKVAIRLVASPKAHRFRRELKQRARLRALDQAFTRLR
jgi:hypothetical protein